MPQAHYQGKRHQRRVGGGGAGGAGGGLQSCPLCRVTTTSAEHMALHLRGRAHQRKLRILAVQRGRVRTSRSSHATPPPHVHVCALAGYVHAATQQPPFTIAITCHTTLIRRGALPLTSCGLKHMDTWTNILQRVTVRTDGVAIGRACPSKSPETRCEEHGAEAVQALDADDSLDGGASQPGSPTARAAAELERLGVAAAQGGAGGATAVGAGLVYVCRVCGITTTSPENLQAHFDGAQHKCAPAPEPIQPLLVRSCTRLDPSHRVAGPAPPLLRSGASVPPVSPMCPQVREDVKIRLICVIFRKRVGG